jgi:hypothetical protein
MHFIMLDGMRLLSVLNLSWPRSLLLFRRSITLTVSVRASSDPRFDRDRTVACLSWITAQKPLSPVEVVEFNPSP